MSESTPPPATEAETEALETIAKATADIRRELAKVIVGQDEVIEQLLIAIFSPGALHARRGCPGLAKT